MDMNTVPTDSLPWVGRERRLLGLLAGTLVAVAVVAIPPLVLKPTQGSMTGFALLIFGSGVILGLGRQVEDRFVMCGNCNWQGLTKPGVWG